jgi:hypothetical protein
VRVATDWNSANIILKSLQDQITGLQTQDLDFHGRRITNAGNGVNPQDYVTVAQIPSIPASVVSAPGNFTIVFSTSGSVSTGQLVPPYNVGPGRTGNPLQVWISSNAPLSTQSTYQITITNTANPNGLAILTTPLILPANSPGPIQVSNFINPLPFFSLGSDIDLEIISADGSGGILSVGVVIQLQTASSQVGS